VPVCTGVSITVRLSPMEITLLKEAYAMTQDTTMPMRRGADKWYIMAEGTGVGLPGRRCVLIGKHGIQLS
jgi:hypothetical protein